MVININDGIDFQTLNRRVRDTGEREILINGCIGQRYVGSGISDKKIDIHGTPGNALGAPRDKILFLLPRGKEKDCQW